MILRRFFLRIILKRRSTVAHVYMRRHQGAKVKHFDVSNVIYHKFSHGAFSYTLNGENVNVILEFGLSLAEARIFNLQKEMELRVYQACKDTLGLFANMFMHTGFEKGAE